MLPAVVLPAWACVVELNVALPAAVDATDVHVSATIPVAPKAVSVMAMVCGVAAIASGGTTLAVWLGGEGQRIGPTSDGGCGASLPSVWLVLCEALVQVG